MPYETAPEVFGERTGGELSTERKQELTNAVGQGLEVLDGAPSRAEIAAKIAEVAEGRRGRPVVVWAIEGADGPPRPETAKARRPGRKQQRAKRAPAGRGRGGIASAHKFICHARLTRSGAWGYVANSNPMLALRCAKYNGTCARVFARYRQKILEQSQQKNVKK